jgi:hypothetical protein
MTMNRQGLRGLVLQRLVNFFPPFFFLSGCRQKSNWLNQSEKVGGKSFTSDLTTTKFPIILPKKVERCELSSNHSNGSD